MTHGGGALGLVSKLSDYLPDPRRPALPDILNRNLFFQAVETTTHSTLAIGNEQEELTHELQRIKRVRVGDVTGGTVTIQVQVDGRDMFLDANRPVSGLEEREPDARYTFPAGSVLKTIYEAETGVPASDVRVVIELEPFVLVPPLPEVKVEGKDRLFPSRRRAAQQINDEGSGRGGSAVNRRLGNLGSAQTANQPPTVSLPPGVISILPPVIIKPPPVPRPRAR